MKYLAIFILCLITNILRAQKHDNVWLIGVGIIEPPQSPRETSYKIDFGSGVFRQDTIIREMEIRGTTASICDTAGNLQFYTNGIFINDHTHQLMENGDSLGDTDLMYALQSSNAGFVADEAAIILPHSDSSHLYHLFYQTIASQGITAGIAEGLYYALIDMQANNGRGRVRFKQRRLLQTTTNEKIDACQLKAAKHANGVDWWLVQPLADSIGFATFLIKGDSIIRQPNQYFHQRKTNTGGSTFVSFSPDATIYAMQNFLDSTLHIFRFNRCTGGFHKHFTQIKDTVRMGQLVFSPSNRFLYISDAYHLYQYNLKATDIADSKVRIGDIFPVLCDSVVTNDCTVLSYLINAPDGKIYALSNRTYLHTIEQPNDKGTACDFRPHSIAIASSLISSFSVDKFPNFPHYRTPAIPESECWTNEEEQGGEIISSVAENESGMIKLYPNPAKDKLILQQQIAFIAGTTVQIYNSLGQLVQSQNIINESQTIELNVSSLVNGSYFVRINDGEAVSSKLFIITK